ncbi:MAG: proteasome ATPase [Corynebacterium sp.]|nr:proteasome ATPase [Corynebacterium sp.]
MVDSEKERLASNELHKLRMEMHKLEVRNTTLARLLYDAREKLEHLLDDVKEMAQPASTYGVFMGYSSTSSDGNRDAEVFTNGRLMRVKVAPRDAAKDLRIGQRVRLGDGFVLVEGTDIAREGALVTISERLDDDRAIIASSSHDESVALIAEHVRDDLKAGDTVLIDAKAGVILEKIVKTEVANLQLEEIPDVSFADIGGLDEQITQIRDSVELPFLHPNLYRDFDLHPPKGVLLYGPPGCGKTLIAKAVANSLAKQMGDKGESYFINVKGPELLNKYVGETERHIRLIFERARELAAAAPNRPVIVFFDEMESIFRTRGTGVSSDMETTVVPQLLTELDGVEQLDNVIIIGATNRDELIDPAIMRPGRLDIKVRVSRPNKQGAKDIFTSHFKDAVPHEGSREELIDGAVAELYADRPFVRLNFAGGDSEVLHYRDFVSGAMIANIMSRAKKLAIKDALREGDTGASASTIGINASHLSAAIQAEQEENENLPTTSNPEEWAKIISGTGRGMTAIGSKLDSVDYIGMRRPTWHV